MSEGILIALISFGGAVIGAAISAFGSIVASERKEGNGRITCGVTGLIASIGALGGLVLGAVFGVLLMQAAGVSDENKPPATVVFADIPEIATQAYDENEQIPSMIEGSSAVNTPLLGITPLSTTCSSVDPYCRLSMQINWGNIDLEKGDIYLVAYHPNYGNPGPLWWITGSGFTPRAVSGTEIIDNGQFGNPGDTVQVYICQTTANYRYEAETDTREFSSEPNCLVTSNPIILQLHSQ